MGAGPPDGLWPSDKHTLNVHFMNGDETEKQRVKDLVRQHYNSIPMRLRFRFSGIGSSDIRIQFGTQSSSYIGRQAQNFAGQPTMWLNVHPRLATREAVRNKVQADVLHEFGHMLGLVHEHKHPHCKAKWNYTVLMGRTGWDLDMVRRAYDNDTTSVLGTRWDRAYDRESIMHYTIQRGDTQSAAMSTPENITLSVGDRETLAFLYPPLCVPKRPLTGAKRSGGSPGLPKRRKRGKDH